MALDLSSAWSSPRGWKLITLTVLGLTLLLLVPLYQLSDHDNSGIYSHLTKYLGHEGTGSSDPASGAFNNGTDLGDIISDGDFNSTEGIDSNLNETDDSKSTDHLDDSSNQPESGDTDAEGKDKDDKPEGDETKSAEESIATEEATPTEESKPDDENKSDGEENKSEDANKSEDENKSEETSKPDGDENKSEEENKAEDEANKTETAEGSASTEESNPDDGENKSDGDENKSEEETKPDDENKSEDENKSDGDDGNDENKDEPPEEIINNAPVYPESREHPCDGFPNMDKIMLVMKTGATEAYTKLPTQLLTGLQCIDDFLLFSDLDQQVGNYHVYDVLEDVKDEAKKNLMEFDLYAAQASCPVSQTDCTDNMKGGWELDKYKFLHMIERTWRMRPDMEWYVFAEADSYVFWPNLVWWLRNKVNTEKHPYLGSVAMLKNMPFAHGGSGYILSGETVKAMAATPGLADKYDLMAPHECCGDYLMALAVNETGSKVKQAHPMINGEKPSTLPFGHGHWCEPLLTMHHMNSEEVSSAWSYEQKRNKTGILQIKDMYESFFAPTLIPQRDDWDNLSDDVCFIAPDEVSQAEASDHQKGRQKSEDDKNPVERQAHLSQEHCSRVCVSEGLDISQEEYDSMDSDSERFALVHSRYERKSEDKAWNQERHCFQWRYHGKACCIAKSFKLGKPRKEEKAEDKYTAGWFVDGINKWIEAKGDCEPEWKNID
ncbi:hypothetical protein AK830_g373 [Neonectria ditissima]|uniref:Uncharacterized protein n=1 Tax=Neonectria ditissima TaxID=78410 RepID=A0A0P7BQE2_9HYPO|nr:hypothetical protein AK830_g373 [Neonectria ditissima]